MNDREEWICANIGLVHACAKRFTGRGMEYDDLFQAGCMGLVKAADGFDESRGLKFSTYAVPVILGEMRRLFRDGGTVKVSRSLKELALRATREREGYIHREGREPTIGELADLLGVDAEQAAEALGASLPPLSLTRAGEEDDGDQIDVPLSLTRAGEEDDDDQIDVPVSPPEESITDHLALQQVLGELDPRDRALIVLRYLNRHTQQATADKLGMTQVQVSRRERVILEQMRKKLIS